MSKRRATSAGSWEASFKARTDLEPFASNAIGLFALALRFGVEDLHSVAAQAITDGYDDKKCDIVHVDRANGLAVIMQCYQAQTKTPAPGKGTKTAAPANKASDLNTAVGWLLNRQSKDLPERLVPPAEELAEGVRDGSIRELYIWFVHNLPESTNVAKEMQTVEETAAAVLGRQFYGRNVAVQAREVGGETLTEWYSNTLSPILVTSTERFVVDDGFKVTGGGWEAFVTTIPARSIRNLYRRHKTNLFSANIRDYLGSRNSDANINSGIKRSAETEPEKFWVYNNGVTILVNDFRVSETAKGHILEVDGMAVVNGAQTTGALGSLRIAPSIAAVVPVRFVKTDSQETVHDIIRFNNSQNQITASDFRSTDATQKRLREEVSLIPEAEYQGGRRGGQADAIRRRPNLMPSYTVGQALASFHGSPDVAYHQKTDVWINDELYARFFNEGTSGSHLVLVYSLLRSVESKKLSLGQKAKTSGALSELERQQQEFLASRGGIFLLVAAIANCLETLSGAAIANPFRASFGPRISPRAGQQIWAPIVEAAGFFFTPLRAAAAGGLRSVEARDSALGQFRSLIASTAGVNAPIYKAFADRLVVRV